MTRYWETLPDWMLRPTFDDPRDDPNSGSDSGISFATEYVKWWDAARAEHLTALVREAARRRPFKINTEETENFMMPEEQKPALTQEQYDRGREVLDGLPPGVYLKCFACGGWQHGGEFSVRGLEWLCEKCSRDG